MTRALIAEASGTLILILASMGTGILGLELADGNLAIALFVNAFATGLALYVLISVLGPLSGAHFNPAVTLFAALTGDFGPGRAIAYVLAQLAGALIAPALTHAMFDLPLFEIAATVRRSPGLWLSEAVATFGLIATILGGLRAAPGQVPALVAAWVGSAYWFTGSTCFANPAVTVARMLTDTFTGIRPADAPGYILAQIAGAGAAAAVLPRLFSR